MKKRIVLFSLIMLLCMSFLQGCSKDGETSIKVVVNDKGTRIEATLKADESKNYKWLYFTKNSKLTEQHQNFQMIFSVIHIHKNMLLLLMKETVIFYILFCIRQMILKLVKFLNMKYRITKKEILS